jgi:hypothetical protein
MRLSPCSGALPQVLEQFLNDLVQTAEKDLVAQMPDQKRQVKALALP